MADERHYHRSGSLERNSSSYKKEILRIQGKTLLQRKKFNNVRYKTEVESHMYVRNLPQKTFLTPDILHTKHSPQ